MVVLLLSPKGFTGRVYLEPHLSEDLFSCFVFVKALAPTVSHFPQGSLSRDSSISMSADDYTIANRCCWGVK